MIAPFCVGIAVLAALSPCTATAVERRQQPSIPANSTPIYQFPSNFVTENLIQRQSGELLITLYTPPGVYQLDPNAGPSQTPRLIHNFTQFTAGGGIVELEKDVFAAAFGNGSLYNSTIRPGGWGLWQIDLRSYQAPTYNPSQIKVKQLISVPEAQDLDGLAIINQTTSTVAAADFVAGVIRSIDISTNSSGVLSNSTLLKGNPPSATNPLAAVGVNGLKFFNSSLYFTTTAKFLYGSLPIDTVKRVAAGPIRPIFNYTNFYLDDFNFASNGNAYITVLTEPNVGIIKRPASIPVGVNGSYTVVTTSGANAVVLNSTKTRCTLYFNVAEQARVDRAILSGAC